MNAHDPVHTNEICMSVRGLAKKFCKNLLRSMYYGLGDIVKGSIALRSNSSILRKDEFWALEDISFDLRKKQVIGIIGPNGAGKTTLLRILARIFPPDKGEIMVNGRVATLLSTGVGFHPHMTVRENIFINGTILGMSYQEISHKFDSILNFSGIKEFINTPVAALSDGMYIRLGFSIAIAMQPNIFLIDEILAVGDKDFREKCIEQILKVSQNSAIIFVSHNMDLIKRICNRIIILNQGKKVIEGNDVDEIVNQYLVMNSGN